MATQREITAAESALLADFRRHQGHASAADSLYGRCVICGMHWGALARGQALTDELQEVI